MRPQVAGRFTLLDLARAVAAACFAARVVRLGAVQLPFDELVARLRSGRPFRGNLAFPDLHLRVVGRLHRLLPPWWMGPCMKRSLLLLHLWSRCGLRPSLHLGVARDEERRFRGHAWLTADAGGIAVASGTGDGWTEAFVFGSSEASSSGDGAAP